MGYAVVANAYQHLTTLLHADAILVVDGGSDSLMAGDENEIATIEEDHPIVFLTQTGYKHGYPFGVCSFK